MCKIAVVTGANKGIGFSIVKGLCQRFSGQVYLTSRDEYRGICAVRELENQGLQPLYHQLDVTDDDSIFKFCNHIVEKHGGIDILINNAGVYYPEDSHLSYEDQAEEMVKVNYYSVVRVCNILFPIMREEGRVINISSGVGVLSHITSKDLQKKFIDPSLTVQELNELMQQYLEDVNCQRDLIMGWGICMYAISKVAISALSKIQQRNFDNEEPNRNVVVNCVHPGLVRTDATENMGPLTPDQGAIPTLFLALEDHNFRGEMVRFDCKVHNWQAL